MPKIPPKQIQPGSNGQVFQTSGGIPVWGTVPSAAGVPPLNFLHNGNFNVWQRTGDANVVSNVSGTNNLFAADRWKLAKFGSTSVWSLQGINGPNNGGTGPHWRGLLATVTTADASVGATDRVYIEQVLEGLDAVQIYGRQVTLSFWARASTTGTYCVCIQNGAATSSYVSEYTINSANTWEFKTVTVTIPSGSGWTVADHTAGLRVIWALSAGTTYQTTAGSFNATAAYATSNQTQVMTTVSSTFALAGCQLELGAEFTKFAEYKFAAELLKCQRYYCKSYEYANLPGSTVTIGGPDCIAFSYTGAGDAFQVQVTFPIPMRVAPTIVIYRPGATNSTDLWDMLGAGTGTVAAGNAAGQKTLRVYTSSTQSGTRSYYTCFTADAEL